MTCPTELRKRYQQGRVIPFVGAGVSMSVTWEVGGVRRRGPSWAELVDQATKTLGFDDPALARMRGTDLQILEYFALKNAGQTAKLTNWFSQNVNPPDSALSNSRIHKALAALDKCHVFYTTNYDNFLERSFNTFGRRTCVVAVEAEMGVADAACEIIKFHGDLEHPNRIVLTESDYERRLSLTAAMDYRLRADLLGRVVLFIGYSFRDPNVSYLFRLFSEHFSDQPDGLPGDRAYIVVPDPSDFELELFRARKIRVIAVRGAALAEDIAKILEEMEA